MTWLQQLRRASYGGVPFGVLGGELRVGRRNAVHTYPFKDQVWVEDLGREARRITLTGFLVENGAYGGGAVIAQREQMVAACESEGPSTLVHPTLGSLQVSLLDATFREHRDQGRVFEIAFSFIEGGQRQFPSADTSTVDQVLGMADLSDVAGGSDFLSAVTSALGAGAAVVNMAVSTVAPWVSAALMLAGDATNLMNTAALLSGSYGRFFGTGLRGISGRLTLAAGAATSLDRLIASASALRAGVTTATGALTAAAANLSVSTVPAYTAAAQGVPAALLAATTDPGDSMRMLSNLAAYWPAAPTPTSSIGTAMATMQSASGDLFRRAAVVAVCRAASSYQPSSYDDAVTVRDRVTTLLDAEIQTAGDQGEDATYTALRNLRAAVVQDLTARGANLAALMTIATPRPMPALALAQRVYRDAKRSDELVTEAAPVHPAFMPTSFRGLAQ